MRRTLIFAAFAVVTALAVSCGSKELTPMQQAVADKMAENHPGLTGFTFSAFAVKDSVRLGSELDRRQKLFESKLKAENNKAHQYASERKPKNTELHLQRARQTREILDRIEAYRQDPSFAPQSVIYYIVAFEGSGKIDGGRAQTGAMEATVGPDLKVYNIQPAGGNINTGMGAAIPGYMGSIVRPEDENVEGE